MLTILMLIYDVAFYSVIKIRWNELVNGEEDHYSSFSMTVVVFFKFP